MVINVKHLALIRFVCVSDTSVLAMMDLPKVFDGAGSYYTYTGSITTPPCHESVQWVIFKTPLIVSQSAVCKPQINTFINNQRMYIYVKRATSKSIENTQNKMCTSCVES